MNLAKGMFSKFEITGRARSRGRYRVSGKGVHIYKGVGGLLC